MLVTDIVCLLADDDDADNGPTNMNEFLTALQIPRGISTQKSWSSKNQKPRGFDHKEIYR